MGSVRNVFHLVMIINATYQTGNLYFSGKYVADSNSAEDTLPTGVILPFGGSAAPAGWLLCDGTAVSRWTYRRLFAVIGTAFGAGNGSTTFNVPNLKGVSPTGVGSQDINGRTKTGPNLGEVREDQMQGHKHNKPGNNFVTDGGSIQSGTSTNRYTTATLTGTPANDGTNGEPRTWAYTHGPEIGVNFIIKI
jgi:microcystin-dependent protein